VTAGLTFRVYESFECECVYLHSLSTEPEPEILYNFESSFLFIAPARHARIADTDLQTNVQSINEENIADINVKPIHSLAGLPS
jgi:hypothetical protein